MIGSKRVYAARTPSRPPAKRRALSVRRQLFKLKETKTAVKFHTVAPAGANGTMSQIISDYNSVNDALQSDEGLLLGMNVRCCVSWTSGGSEFVRVLILKGKRDETITTGTPLWLDAATDEGRPGTSTEVLALEQMVYPINKDGFVVKYDHLFKIGNSTAGAGPLVDFHQQFIRMNEKIQIYDDTNAHSANYFICVFGIKYDGTASSAVVNTGVELLFKDQV